MDLSVVFPVYNEEENVAILLDEIAKALAGTPWSYELIAVDDGSRDRSLEVLRAEKARHPTLRIITFEKNSGQIAETAEVMAALADLYRLQRRNSEAESLYERLIPIQEMLLGREHQEVAGSVNLLAELYRQDGLYDMAEPLYRRSLAILEKEQPMQGAALARSLKTFAAMLRHMKRKPEAVALEARAKAILEGRPPGQAFAASLVN